MKPVLSIIYVYYNTPEEIKSSINSLTSALGKISYEIVIVNNASVKAFPKELRNLSNIKIIINNENYGYGNGLNQGVGVANGKYLLLVNPDIEFKPNSIKYLLDKIEKKSEIGVIGPQLIDRKGKVLQSISGMPYLPKALIIFSFIGRIWRHNPILKEYHNANLDRDMEQYVDVIGGACMIVRRSLFNNIGGFDDRFFMYFDEADFCFRIKKVGYKILYLPKAKVIHLIGRSTQNKEWIRTTFEQSRFKFFKKYHGLIPAIMAELILRFFKPSNIILLIILALSVFLNFYKINERMIFIGDQGWFYISARDMLLSGKIPLVGITSSHTWLHQGPLWTYLLALILWIFNYNPLSGGYFTALLCVATVFFMYELGKEMFSKRIGLISALLYATSPLVVVTSQMPYHTSPIPLFTLLFIFSLYKFIKGNSKFFPISVLFLSILYNLELANVVLWFILFIILIYGIWKKTEWIKRIFNKKILIYSILTFTVPMVPILIHDFYNNFSQTLKFVVWVGYKILFFFGFSSIHGENQLTNSNSILAFSFQSYQNLIFAASSMTAFIILIFSFGVLLINIYSLFKEKIRNVGFVLLILWLLIPYVGYFINQTPSGAYLPLFFPAVIYLTAFSFEEIIKIKIFTIPVILLILFIAFINSYFIILSKDSVNALSFSKRVMIAKEIVKKSEGKEYNIIGRGDGSQFESFTMNYEYLVWWLGHSPAKSTQKLKYIIQEDKNGISLVKNE